MAEATAFDNKTKTSFGAEPVKIEIRRVPLSEAELEKFYTTALKNAARIGLTAAEWDCRRQVGDPLANDILMTVAPDRFLRGE